MATNKIYQRERARRKALWELARFAPGDPMSASALRPLEDIDALGTDDLHLPGAALSIDEVANSVPEEELPTRIWIVRDAEIPQLWRERFRCASAGSTRVVEGPYATDWEKFLRKWNIEICHLDEHTSELARRG